jgi:hypothetical protein
MRGGISKLCLLLLFTVVGCGTLATDTPLNPAPHPLVARSPESVEIFSSAPPSREHQDVALIKVDQTEASDDDPRALMLRQLREHAAAMGCDAVFLGAIEEATMSATCIVYRNPGDVGVASTPPSPRPRTCIDRKDFDDHRDCILAPRR